VTADIVREVCQDFDLTGKATTLLAPANGMASAVWNSSRDGSEKITSTAASSTSLAAGVKPASRTATREMFAGLAKARRRYLIF
jgi:hypothetical protein